MRCSAGSAASTSTQNLDHLAEIAEQFEQAASTQPLFQLWWVVGALLEALRDGGIETNVSIKRLLGHVDRELRRLQDQGEQRYAASPPVELLNNLLYYVAQSSRSGRARGGGAPVVRPAGHGRDSDRATTDAAEALSAPSVRLMKTVAAAIREDLTRVKDVLDIFVRKGATQVEDLRPQLEMLRKISDTLGVLGLGALRDAGRGRARVAARRSSSGASRRTTPRCSSIAAALIAVEDSLDAQLLRLILPDAGGAGAPANRPTKNSVSCRTPCCANASSTWRASRKRSRNRCRRRPKRRVSTRCRSSCAASRPAC